MPFLDAAHDREAFPGGVVHLAAAGCLLGRLPVLHVVGGAAAHRAIPDANDDLVFPGLIYPHNYLPLLPALAASLFAFPVLSRGWRPTIYRVCIINSCCHMYSVWYAIRGQVAEWVPTGASPDTGQVPVTVNRILCSWITIVQLFLWSGLALRVHEYGWHAYWATEVLAGVQLYMLAPLLTPKQGRLESLTKKLWR